MQEPPWMPRTEEEYQKQLAEDAGPQPDEMTRLRVELDNYDVGFDHGGLAATQEVARLRAALERIKAAVGTSTEAHKIAREALDLSPHSGTVKE